MKLVIDLVVNHTSDEHAWFRESARPPCSPKRDWYWWRPPRVGHIEGRPGRRAERTGDRSSPDRLGTTTQASSEYFLHLFSRKQPDLNWENPEVRQAVYAMMRWWLDRGVDGFRMDVINLISKEPSLPDGAVVPGSRYGDGFPHYSAGPRIHEFLQEMHAEVFGDRSGDFVTVGEMPGVTMDEARLFTDPAARSSTWSSSSNMSDSTTESEESGTRPLFQRAGPEGLARHGGKRDWPLSAGTAFSGTTTINPGS